ncbi:MAG TPA: acetyl-CoA hydrolase/transferase C-terminal domain-containing protein [Chloroflexia bacterium]|nr:acetyl-CoA hydrolase/transferase C-terminal domain-containing protein [Chloroflexia bacterium]
MRFATLQEALEVVRPGNHILLHSACAEPQTLVEGLVEEVRAGEPHLQNLTLYALTYRGAGAPTPAYAEPELLRSGRLRLRSFFPHPALKEASRAGLVDYIPANFSTLPGLIRSGFIRPDCAFVQVTPPNEQGQCSFGPAADLIPALLEAHIPLIAEMNRQMPFVAGPLVPLEKFAAIVESNRPLLEVPSLKVGEIERKVAANVAELVKNGATVQLGVGTIPEAVMEFLREKRDLSLHGGALADGVVDLLQSGAVTNARKPFDKGRTVSALLISTRCLFDYAHNNPAIELQGIDRCNSPIQIARIPDFVSINSALEVDYWGQVNAEALGDWQLAGIGGQLDYVTGAWYSPGGISIIALPSVTPSGKARIVPRLPAGAPVSTPRQLAQIVVTEKGVADLRGKSLSERERLLRSISQQA